MTTAPAPRAVDDAGTTDTLADRRRPGRLDNVSPELVKLLRADERAKLEALVEPWDGPAYAGDRRLNAGQGLVLGAGIGALMWGGIIAAAWAVFRG